MALPDQLDLARKGPAQVDRVLVNPAQVRIDDNGAAQTDNFLRQISQLSSTVGGVLAKRAAERRAEEERQLTEQARLKATNPVEWQRRVEAGEAKESDHPAFHRAYNVYAAQDAAAKAEAEFRAFDVEANDDEAVANFAASARQKYLTGNDSVIYQGAMAEALNGLEANLRGRRAQVVSAQQTEKTYLNFQSSLHDSIMDAVRQGQPTAVAGVIAQQLDRGVAGGLSLSKLLNHVSEAAVEAVYQNPDVADELAAIPLPHVGPGATLGSFASAQLATAEGNAYDRAERKQRLALTQQERAERQQAQAFRRRAAQEVYTTGDVSAETRAGLLQADPEFALKLPDMIEKAESAASELSPEYQEIKRDTALGRVSAENLDAALNANQITFKQYSELSKIAENADKRGGDITKRPGYKMGAESVKRTLVALETNLTASLQGDLLGGTARLTPQQKLAVESVRNRIEFGFSQRVSELLESGADEASAVQQAATEAREAAAAEYEAIAPKVGLGEHANAPVSGPAAPIAAKSNAPPQVVREAQETLTPGGLTALDRLGGFGARAQDMPQLKRAMETFLANGSLTPWARDQYMVFRTNNADVEIDEATFLDAFFFASFQTGASGSE